MRNIAPFVISALTSICILGCETNDPLEDLGKPGEIAANIYFVPIDPIAFVGTTIETEVEYWSQGDDFTSIQLLQSVYFLDDIELELKDVTYSYLFEGTRDKIEEEVYKSIPHSFTSFVPEKNAYVIRPSYEVPFEYKKVTYSKNNTPLASLGAMLSEEANEDFFNDVASNLSMEQLHVVLVEVNNEVSEDTFSSFFEEGSLTENGKASVIKGLKNIGIAALVKDNFSYEVSHRVVLFYRITNGYGVESESVGRAFNVN